MNGPAPRYRLPLALVVIHTALVLFVWQAVRTSGDGEAVMLWGIFYVLDWPMAEGLLSGQSNGDRVGFCLLLFGGAWWATIGVAVQWIVRACRT